MQTIHRGYRGLALLMVLNADRFMTVFAIAGALSLAAYIGGPS